MQKIEKNIPFYLFSSCFTTKGATRSILIDSERKIFEFIPNALEHILKVHQGKTFNELISYDNVNLNVLEEYFNFLINNEFIYFSNDSFWKKNPNYEFENKLLKDIIIDYSIIIKNYFDEIIFQISDLFCEGLLIIFDNNEDEKEVLYVLDKIKHSTIEHLEIYINYSETLNSVYYDWFLKFPFLQLIVFNNCNSEDFKVIDESTNKYVYFTLDSQKHKLCGKIGSFNLNAQHIEISKRFNSCLFGKISINQNGELKSCLSMNKIYGNINQVNISSVLQVGDYIEKYSINKSQIVVCKDCEFQNICTDCRAYTRGNSLYQKPNSCFYNPYIGKWKGESDYFDEKNLDTNQIEFILKKFSFNLSK